MATQAKKPNPRKEASSETTSAERLKELAQDAKLAAVVAISDPP